MTIHYPEKLFRKNFIKAFKELYPKGHINAIESEATVSGVPDLNLCKGGKDLWVELKSGSLTKNSIKPGQFVWHIKRNQAGGTTWIVHRNIKGLINVFHGSRIREFRDTPNKVIPDRTFISLDQEFFDYLFK